MERLILGRTNRQPISVLIFHRVLEHRDPLRPNEPTAEEFEKLIKFLSENFNVRSLRTAVSEVITGKLPAHSVAITFDDGYEDNLRIALPILKKYAVPATFFIASGMIDDGIMWNDRVIEAIRRISGPVLDLGQLGLGTMDVGTQSSKLSAIRVLIPKAKYWQSQERNELVSVLEDRAQAEEPCRLMMTRGQLRDLAMEQLAEIGGHTISHPILKSLVKQEAEREIVLGKESVEKIIKRNIYCFAYPNGIPDIDYAVPHVEMVKSAGYELAVSTSLGGYYTGSDQFQIPRVKPWDKHPLRFGLRMLAASRKIGECVR